MGKAENFAATAQLYSQLAGVLAGFAFVGLMTLVATQVAPRSPEAQLRESAFRSFVPLISAFIGLIATSLDYAVIASDSNRQRASVSETVAGVGFAISGITLFYSILVALHSAQDGAPSTTDWAKNAVRFVRSVTIWGVAPAAFLLLYGGARDNLNVRYKHAELDRVDLSYLIAAVVIIAVLMTPRRKLAKLVRWPASWTAKAATGVSAASASISVIALIACSFIEAEVGPGAAGSRWLQVLIVAVVSVFIAGCIQECKRYR